MRSLLLVALLACPLLGAPPTVDIPSEVKPSGQYVTLTPKTEATAITYVGLSDIEPIPAVLLKDPRTFLLDTRGMQVGRYKFVAVASLNDEHTRVDFVVVIGTPPPVVFQPPVITPPGPTLPTPPDPSKATAVTYIYEKDATAIPNAVLTAFDKLNRQKILATTFEKDTVDGSGETPQQYKIPLVAAKSAGLPAVIVTANENVLKVVKDPTTEQQIFDAVPNVVRADPPPPVRYYVQPRQQPATTRGFFRR